MDLQTGDICINAESWPGHVMMVYEGGSTSSSKTRIIHANSSKNFHIAEQVATEGFITGYLVDHGTTVFRAPWEKLGGSADEKRKEVRDVALAITKSAKYGAYRAVRLMVGSSEFGGGARERLDKYRKRRVELKSGASKFVSTITCAEAVILSYQIVFAETDSPFFIKKDAAHTMPRTLRDWLGDNWTCVQKPS